jgi:hypothetical protein
LTIEDGKALAALQNARYEKAYNDANFVGSKNVLRKEQQLFNDMLEFHFRPRGAHTKCAITQ